MKFNIRKNALRLLVHIYQHCDSNLRVENLNCKSLINSETTPTDIGIASRYLSQKGYIDSIKAVIIDTASCNITPLGIEWVEDCHEKNLI